MFITFNIILGLFYFAYDYDEGNLTLYPYAYIYLCHFLVPKVWYYGGLVSCAVGLLSPFSFYWMNLQREKLIDMICYLFCYEENKCT